MKSIYYDPNLQEGRANRKWFENVKLIGEIDEGTSIYIEDYAHTYLNQCANSDYSYELGAVLIGEQHKESKQVLVYGVILVEPRLLDNDTKWISESVLSAIEEERKCYFPEGEYVGWMHTQPGYGIMPTTKEMAVHKEIFGEDCILMLIDPIYQTAAFFTCNKNQFEEKKGFCIYYEKNELMQKYMEDHPFLGQKEPEANDQVVGDFRALGAKWKQEVERKRRLSRIVSIAVAGILLTVAFIMGIQSQQKKINELENDVVNIYQQYSQIENKMLFNGYD